MDATKSDWTRIAPAVHKRESYSRGKEEGIIPVSSADASVTLILKSRLMYRHKVCYAYLFPKGYPRLTRLVLAGEMAGEMANHAAGTQSESVAFRLTRPLMDPQLRRMAEVESPVSVLNRAGGNSAVMDRGTATTYGQEMMTIFKPSR